MHRIVLFFALLLVSLLGHAQTLHGRVVGITVVDTVKVLKRIVGKILIGGRGLNLKMVLSSLPKLAPAGLTGVSLESTQSQGLYAMMVVAF